MWRTSIHSANGVPGGARVWTWPYGRMPTHRESDMTNTEQKFLMRGVAAGTLIGLAVGLILALFIAMKPDLFAALMP